MRAITRLLRSRRGISTVIGAALAILILISFLVGVYLWTYERERRMSQLDEARTAEGIALRAAFNYEEGGYPVNVTAKNTGSVDVQVIRLWLIDKLTDQHSYVDLDPPLNLRVGETREISIGNLDIDISEGKKVSYTFKITTGRGRIFSTQLELAEAEYTDYPIVVLDGTCTVSASEGDPETVEKTGEIMETVKLEDGTVSGTIEIDAIITESVNSNLTAGTRFKANVTEASIANATISEGEIEIKTETETPEGVKVSETVETFDFTEDTVNITTVYMTSEDAWTLKLTVWNDNAKAITIDKLIVINLANSTYHVMEGDVVEGLPWKIQPRQIAKKTFTGTHTWRKAEPERRVFAGDVRVELLDEKSTVVGTCTLKIAT